MRVVIIGGTGHIGSYLTPRVFEAGHTVICVCRGHKTPYREHAVWSRVQYLNIDRLADEQAGHFGERIASLDGDAVIDLTCYQPDSAVQLVRSLEGRTRHFLHCGTIWVHGHSVEVPTTEDAVRIPFGEYGIRKQAIEEYLLKRAVSGFPVTILHPGHLVGRGWHPINPQGNFNPEIFELIASGRELVLPNFGMETLHHVHADDVAQAFLAALHRRESCLGEALHVVSPRALTLRGYAERMSAFFGQPAKLTFLPFEKWKATATERDSRITFDHLAHSPNCSIEKAKRLIGYVPRYTSLEAVQDCIAEMHPGML